MQRSVGIIGVGNMGLAMALRLRDLGVDVHVRDIDPAREALAVDAGALRAATPAELARRAEVVIVAVVDAVQTEAVLFGADGATAAMRTGG
ncbi:MAG TPA: NAD(P)-binding domain-containing protein, partial [Caldimonas sp.]|nr:NAD(P)-binding domain-containing protein [Caldimonas sp.]